MMMQQQQFRRSAMLQSYHPAAAMRDPMLNASAQSTGLAAERLMPPPRAMMPPQSSARPLPVYDPYSAAVGDGRILPFASAAASLSSPMAGGRGMAYGIPPHYGVDSGAMAAFRQQPEVYTIDSSSSDSSSSSSEEMPRRKKKKARLKK